MTIQQRISMAAMERWTKAKTEEEEAAAGEWANNQLALVSLWDRTGVKPEQLEFD